MSTGHCTAHDGRDKAWRRSEFIKRTFIVCDCVCTVPEGPKGLPPTGPARPRSRPPRLPPRAIAVPSRELKRGHTARGGRHAAGTGEAAGRARGRLRLSGLRRAHLAVPAVYAVCAPRSAPASRPPGPGLRAFALFLAGASSLRAHSCGTHGSAHGTL